MLCPCGSSLLFSACCNPFINKDNIQQKSPSTPEQLMRSRFSAYAIKDAQYIYETYAAVQRSSQSIVDIKSWADECLWIALVVHESTETMVENTVEFSAYYVVDNTLCELREKSNFKLEGGEWRYIDGDITVNNEIDTIKRNEVCPCNNYPTAWSAKKGKKFKHCCAK